MVGKNICLSIVGNKCDRERERQVSAEEGASYAESVGAVYHNTSAKLNRGIEETFFDLAKRMLDARQSGQGQAGSRYQPPFQRQGTANLTISNQPTQQKKGCCGS
eukprot:TRINITY_DN3580_c0_g1_i2.p1 TRINITY_DN3580_c0_g1~~TRINITY_DN3580_c0_g1_i2.p1  ORF type:complete len:105 (-),score=23.97 TRINITY_DN3580_c0_g1_i2:193-507(-)